MPAATAVATSAFVCDRRAIIQAEASPTPTVNLEKVKAAIAQLIESDAEKRNDGTSLKGTFVRLGEPRVLPSLP